MSRRIRRDLHKRIGASGYEQIAGDLEVRGKILGPSINDITATIDKIVSGTTTPVKLTITKYEGIYKGIILQWAGQYNLRNFDHYEVQVSADNTNWYSLKFDGINWGDVLNGDTDTLDGMIVHAPIPFLGTAEAPIGRKLYYRMRQKTILGAVSAWSDVVNATTSVVQSGDVGANTFYGNQMRVGEIRAREIAFADDVYGNAHENPTGAELFDLAQPDCRSSIGRIPSVRNTVFAPGEIEDELGNKYLGPHAPRFIGQSGAIFAARTNLVADPENLTTANWADWGACTELLSEYFTLGGQRYTKIAATAASSGRTQTITFTGNAVKSYQGWLRRGNETSTSYIGIYDGTVLAWKGLIEINWTTKAIVAAVGTLMHYEWNGDDEVWVAGITTTVTAANLNYFLILTTTNGAFCYATACQAENAEWPSPYIDRTRWITQTRPATSPNYAVTMPGKFLFKIKTKPWFHYTTAGWHFVEEWYVDATHYFAVLYNPTDDYFFVAWRDGGTERYLVTSVFTTNINQELTFFGALNLDSGGGNDSRFIVFLEDGTKFSEDTIWNAAPDIKASTFPTLSVGHGVGGSHSDSVISYTKLWTWDGATLGTINSEADVDAITQNKTSLFDLELEPYETAYQPISKQGAIGLFPAATNLVASPEDLTTASWTNDNSTDALSDYYIGGRRFTKVTATAADGQVDQVITFTGNTVKSLQAWVKKGDDTISRVILYDSSIPATRLQIDITWATKTVAASTGTLRDAIWISDDMVWVSGISTAVTAANVNRVYLRSPTNGKYSYFTAIQAEDSLWPTSYTPTTRTVGRLTYKMPDGLPDKFSIVFWVRPWFSYDVGTNPFFVYSHLSATQRFGIRYDGTNDNIECLWRDNGIERFLDSQVLNSATLLNQWIMVAVSIDLSVGGITTGSFLKVYAPGSTFTPDTVWDGAIDAKTGNFTMFTIGSRYDWTTHDQHGEGFYSDFLFLPGVLLTEEDYDRHYNMTRPWYSPSEAAAGDRSVRIDKSGIRMHNAALTISDNLNRTIDISNRTGLLAKDAAGTIIHDIPNAPILTNMIYGGHLLWKEAPNYISSIVSLDYTDNSANKAASSAITNVNLSTYLPAGLTNVKGILAESYVVIYAAANKLGVTTALSAGSLYGVFYNAAPGLYNKMTEGIWSYFPSAAAAASYAIGVQCLVPIVFSGSTPYVTWRVSMNFLNMAGNVGRYYAFAYLFLLGWLI